MTLLRLRFFFFLCFCFFSRGEATFGIEKGRRNQKTKTNSPGLDPRSGFGSVARRRSLRRGGRGRSDGGAAGAGSSCCLNVYWLNSFQMRVREGCLVSLPLVQHKRGEGRDKGER